MEFIVVIGSVLVVVVMFGCTFLALVVLECKLAKRDRPQTLGFARKDCRGYGIVEFTDANDTSCSIQESSAIGPDLDAVNRPGASMLWLGTRGNRMHLTRDQAEGVVCVLKTWLETGCVERDEA